MFDYKRNVDPPGDGNSSGFFKQDWFLAIAIVFVIMLGFTVYKSDFFSNNNSTQLTTQTTTNPAFATLSEIERKKAFIQQNMNELHELSQSLQDRQKLIQDLVKDANEKELALKATQLQLKDQERQIQKLQKEKNKSQETIASHEQKNQELLAQIDQLTVEKSQAETRIKDQEELIERISELEQIAIESTDHLETLLQEIAQRSEKIESLNKANAALSEKNERNG
jgi:chromosome segregation ATPase